MRTLYFLEEGQKLNDINPSERRRALLVSKEEWSKFEDHLVKKQRASEVIEREKEEMEQRKHRSKEMAKTWDNTIMVCVSLCKTSYIKVCLHVVSVQIIVND